MTSTAPAAHPQLALIGGGVRGTAALGRLVARLHDITAPLPAAPHKPGLTLHCIDPHPLGSGRIWRADQPHTLVMNTVAAQSTVFDDDSLGFDHSCPGPTFAEWCAGIANGSYTLAPGETAANTATFTALAARTTPWDTPSRALYGAYLRWAHTHLLAQLPTWVTVHRHVASAVDLVRHTHGFTLTLSSGETLTADAVLLAVGWLPRPTTQAHDLTPESPIDQAVERIGPRESVAVRGVGMGFTDLLSLVTESRGGHFTPQPTAAHPWAVRYVATGHEPRLYAGSRTGAPFLAKPSFGTVPPAPQLTAFQAWLPALLAARHTGPLNFASLVLPLIERDSARAHYATLATHQPERFATDPLPLLTLLETAPEVPQDPTNPNHHALADALAADTDRWQRLATELVPEPAHRFAPERLDAAPTGSTADAIDRGIRERIAADATEASRGARSALKMGLHVYQAARAAIVPLTDFWGVSDDSVRAHERYLTRAGLAGSGPPLFRVEQLLALHDAGLVRFMGPQLQLTTVGGQRFVSSALAPTDRFAVDRVADAFLSLPDARHTDDPLITALLRQGVARVAQHPQHPTTGALDIDPATSQLVDASGQQVAGLASVGVLHEQIRRFTIIAPIPHARSTVLREIDAAVDALLAHALPKGDAVERTRA